MLLKKLSYDLKNLSLEWRRPVVSGLIKGATDIDIFYKEYASYQYLLREKILLIQHKKMLNLLDHAFHHVPYYQELFSRHGLVCNNVVSLDRFNEIPHLTKEIIREQGKRLHSSDKHLRKWYLNTSGGSTGEPVSIIQDLHYRNASLANKIIYNEMLNKKIGEKEIKLWGSEKDILAEHDGADKTIINWLYNRTTLNSFFMNDERMKRYVETINATRPKIMWAYIDSLYELARYIEKNNLTIHSPHAILATAGTVDMARKKYIARVFNSVVCNQYGSREVGGIATECLYQQGLHTFEYLYCVEILNDQLKPTAPNEIGEVYITSLINYSMPLIRYRLGDLASWSSNNRCPCGRNLRLIHHVHGRVTDHFKKHDGALVHGEYFTHLFYFKPWIKQFQVVQTHYNTIVCNIVKNSPEKKSDVQDITRAIKKAMGDACNVSFTYCNEIRPTPSGKYRYTINALAE